jgi:PIN domain nuclease of toxin-antitoxin system/antitoxin (DNA-binding transcriptional repressor) of toxin-antitoxin stability system
MITATIFEAKTNLSELLKKAQAGETVIITSGREKTPIAKLEAIHPTPKQRLGGLEDPNFVLTDAFWEDLPEGWTLIWAKISPASLSRQVAEIMADPRNDIFVSAATAWEIATKVRLGKLPGADSLERDFLKTMEDSGYTLLPIEAESSLRAGRLIADHGDPFDRIIAAQALAMDIPVLSTDTKLDLFGVRRLW